MNYASAREMMGPDGKGTGRWHYTVRNDDRIWRHQCCRECAHANDGHPSRDEAYACAHEFALKLAEEWKPCSFDSWHGCVVCDAPTKEGATWGSATPGWPNHEAFCAEHLTLENVRAQVREPGDTTYS